MCDYSLHAVASRPAMVGEKLITTTFRGTSTRGFASEREPAVAVCLLPGTELAFAQDVTYDRRWVWKRTLGWRVGKFTQIELLPFEGTHTQPAVFIFRNKTPLGFSPSVVLTVIFTQREAVVSSNKNVG